MTDPPHEVLRQASRATDGQPIRSAGLLFAALISVCAYPALFVYFHNIREAVFQQTFSPTLIFTAVGMAAWLISSILSGGMVKGALVAVLFMLVFMNYSLVDDSLRSFAPDWRWWRIAPAGLFLFVNLALVLRVLVTRPEGEKSLSRITLALGLIYMSLNLFNAATGIAALAGAPREKSRAAVTDSPGAEEPLAGGLVGQRPNFYFFLFDEYARQDVLKKYTGYDNIPFLKELERKGFNISYSSLSTSSYTNVSIGNSLHYDVYYKTAPKGFRRPPLFVVFKKAGYQTYWHSLDYRIDEDLTDVVLRSTAVLTALSIEQTVLARSFIAYWRQSGNEALRADRLGLLKKAGEIVEEKTRKPKFLFFHFMGPHEPFLFDENGGPVAYENMHNWADTRYYSGQLRFLSKKIEELADTILEKDPRSVVLMQSDHGARYFKGLQDEEQRACLNILYLSGLKLDIEGQAAINTLRLAIRHALGLKLEPLRIEP